MFYVGFVQFHEDVWRVRYFPDLTSAFRWVSRLVHHDQNALWGKVGRFNSYAIECECSAVVNK